MPSSDRDEETIDRYVESVGTYKGGSYSLNAEEALQLVRNTHEGSSLRLELLTGLQRALPLPRSEEKESSKGSLVQELKGALTNVIIMQTRLNERGQELVELVERAVQDGELRGVALDPEVLRPWARGVLEANQRVAR